MRRLVCAFVVRKTRKTVLLTSRLILCFLNFKKISTQVLMYSIQKNLFFLFQLAEHAYSNLNYLCDINEIGYPLRPLSSAQNYTANTIHLMPDKYHIPPSSIRLWNSLEDDLKNLSTLQTFKKHITSSFNNSCVPSHFTIGNRYISILHARLRNNCSNLNNDLFRNHLRDNPLCDLCGMIEDAIHYFFHCRKFTLERQVFNDTVRVFQPLSIDMILCGNFNLNMENNIVLFRAVHRYIHATKRFKTS